jgi:hypothetical protein
MTGNRGQAVLAALNISASRQYNYVHTYATISPMTCMNLDFIPNQFGRSVQMPLSTYARWINHIHD